MSRGRYDLLNPCPGPCGRMNAMADEGHRICRQCEGVEPRYEDGLASDPLDLLQAEVERRKRAEESAEAWRERFYQMSEKREGEMWRAVRAERREQGLRQGLKLIAQTNLEQIAELHEAGFSNSDPEGVAEAMRNIARFTLEGQ